MAAFLRCEGVLLVRLERLTYESMNGIRSMPFPVDGRWINATEAKLGVRFPASFVASMAKMNGGAVDLKRNW